MKAMLRNALIGILTMPLAVLMQGCEHKELCYDHSHMVDLRVDFDWSLAPDATPRTMVVRLYRSDGSHYAAHEFTSTTSGRIRVEAGDYMLLCHNGELVSVQEGGNSFDEYRLSTKSHSLLAPIGRADVSAPPRPGTSPDEPVRTSPEQVWAAACPAITLQPQTEGQSVTLTPAEATCIYHVTVSDVENLTSDIDVSGAITGMSEQWSVAACRPSGCSVTLPVALERPDAHTLSATFYAFGHCHEETTSHYFSLYSSNNVYKDFDITDQVHAAEDPRHVYIELSGFVLPEPGSGMNPDISGWDQVVDTEIDMQ